MQRPQCPFCGNKPLAAFLRPSFRCPQCDASLSSNLRVVSLFEWVIGGGIFVVIVFALHGLDVFRGWSYAELMSLLFLPACLIHAVVIVKFVQLRLKTTENSGGQTTV